MVCVSNPPAPPPEGYVTVLGLVGGAWRHRASPIHRRRARAAPFIIAYLEGYLDTYLFASDLQPLALPQKRSGAPSTVRVDISPASHFRRISCTAATKREQSLRPHCVPLLKAGKDKRQAERAARRLAEWFFIHSLRKLLTEALPVLHTTKGVQIRINRFHDASARD